MAAIEAEAARMGVLVDDLLLLARLDQGRPLEQAPVDLGAIAGEAVDAARAIDPARLFELAADGDLTVVGDAGRLRQVVDNLLENVRTHTPAGTPARVRVVRDGATVLVSVADEGPGVPEEARSRAFERFYRADDARSRETGGAGLGLALVAAIVEAHGGTVAFAASDRGTVVEVRVPVRPPAATPEPPAPGDPATPLPPEAR
jgi:two-component system OmpR family sensor kinase